MLTGDCCTLYRANGTGFDRYVIGRCHWQECRASNVLKSGLLDADGITVYVPADAMTLFPDGRLYPSDRLLAGFDISPQKPARDMLVKGECPFVFDASTPQTVSSGVKALNAQYEAHTVMSVDRLLYGRGNLDHYKLSAR